MFRNNRWTDWTVNGVAINHLTDVSAGNLMRFTRTVAVKQAGVRDDFDGLAGKIGCHHLTVQPDNA